jgi:tRNA threonylcarbamoyladenosine modification (KEOPS) complex  Pcc1 subunit
VANSYDGFTATWTISNIICSPSDGEITITVTAEDVSGSGTVIADNTVPTMTVSKPSNGLYLFNRRFLPMSRTVIIGGLTIEIESEDSSGIDHTEFYIDGQLTKATKDSQWYMNMKFMGRHTLEIRVYDNAGNTHTETVAFSGYNLFGTE